MHKHTAMRGLQCLLKTNSKSPHVISSVKHLSSTPKKQKAQPLLTYESINPAVKKVEYAVRGPIVIRGTQIEEEMAKGVSKPFSKVIKANIGDCHAMGQKPITFIRQLIAACSCPSLIDEGIFPSDVNDRARRILGTINGSTGCYSPSSGLTYVKNSITQYITNRDGYQADPNNLIITNGASSSVKLILELFANSTNPTGVMIPIPQYPLYSATVDEFGMEPVHYYLNEERDWGMDVEELRRSLLEARLRCDPKVLCVINPGNPTGQVLPYENIRDIILLAMEENLFVMADEVYQDNIYKEGAAFHSFRKVLMDLGPEKAEGFQMASFHSTSKGYFGECGLRGGYVEYIGLDDKVGYELNKLQSAQLGSNVTGQLVMDAIMDPPKEGEPSAELFYKEKNDVLQSLNDRAKLVYESLNKIEGVTCNQVAGAMYAFPQVTLPQKAIDKAKSLNMAPDFFYCLQLLENYGILVVPGSGFGQKEGTWHFRMTILPPMEDLKAFIERYAEFHNAFTQEYQ